MAAPQTLSKSRFSDSWMNEGPLPLQIEIVSTGFAGRAGSFPLGKHTYHHEQSESRRKPCIRTKCILHFVRVVCPYAVISAPSATLLVCRWAITRL